jgi:subtilisin family serine protease
MKLIFATLALLICWQNTAHSKVELDSSLKQIEEDANPIASQKLNVLFTFEKQAVIADQLTLSQMMAVTQVLIEAFKVEYPGLAKRRIKGFPLLNGFSVSLSPAEIEKVLKMKGLSGVHWLDEKVTIALPRGESSQIASRKYPYAWGVEKIGVKTLQETYPEIDGSGVRIGVLDTGIKPTHRDLEDKILHFKNFSLDHNDEPADEYDHGTHIAGTLVGEAHSGRVIGVAPGAKLVVARIFDRSGQSTKERILEAMHWMLDPDEDGETDDSVHIVNASWGTRSSYEERSPEDVPYCQIVKIWAEMNIIAVFAAGNNGPAEASIGLPGGCPSCHLCRSQ